MSKALLKAAAAGQDAKLQALLAEGAAIDFADRMPGRTALIEAAINGHAHTVQWLIGKGADIDRCDATLGFTALGWAASQGHVQVLDRLLAAGAALDLTCNDFQHTPLMTAAQQGHASVVTALLAAGADLHVQTDNGRNALSMAEEGGHAEVVALLRAQGARPPLAPQEIYLPWPEVGADLAGVDPGDPASVLRGFILAMSQWEIACHEHRRQAGDRELDWAFVRQGLAQVFERFCTLKPRPQGRGNAIGWPPDYTPDEAWVSIEHKGRRALLMTRQGRDGAMRYEALYSLVRSAGAWRVDTKQDRPWGTHAWERTIL